MSSRRRSASASASAAAVAAQAAPMPLPAQPNAPANVPIASLALPPHPATAVPNLVETVAIRQYVTTLASLRTDLSSLVTEVELAQWRSYLGAIDNASAGGPGVLHLLITTAANTMGPLLAPLLAPLTEAIAHLQTDVNGLRTDVNGLRTDVDGLRTDVDGLRTDFNGVRTDVTSIAAGLRNIPRQKHNATAIAMGHNTPLIPLFKTVASPPVAGVRTIAVGAAVTSPPFPATVAGVDRLTAANIATLQNAYNEDFGIVAGDSMDQKRDCVRRWIQGLLRN